MIKTMIDMLFGCRHKRLTRPITPVNKAKQTAMTYVACLDCGRQFNYDASKMRMGAEISRTAVSDSDRHFQQTSA
jgi:hypothetical protein